MLYTPPPAARAVELTAKQMFMLFPTPMFTGKLPDIGLCDRIEKKLRELQQSGKGTSSREGQILAYMTPDDIHTLPEMKESNRRHHVHVHPNCLLSGLVYVRTPKNCGSTVFASPRQLTKNLEPTYLQKNELNSDLFTVPAEKGRMLIWPSHVPHAVEQGTADESEERIVVAFNIMIRGRIQLFTASLDLS